MRFFAFLFFLSTTCFAGEFDPLPGATKATEGMVWNKWETDNFVVLSIYYDFGNRLRRSIEVLKSELCGQIGLEDVSLPVKCKVVCVPDTATLKRFFSIDRPDFEVRKDGSGSVSEIAVWVDEAYSLDPLIASVCLNGRASFLVNGVPVLLGNASEVSSIVSSSKPSVDFLWDGGAAGRAESASVCLFVRREFGPEAFSAVLRGIPVDAACGFPDRLSFEKTFAKYLENLRGDLDSGKTPEGYLSPLR